MRADLGQGDGLVTAPDPDSPTASDWDEARTLANTTPPWETYDPRDAGHGQPDKGWE